MIMTYLFYGREMHTCEIIADHPQGEESLSKTEPEEDITVIHAL